MQIELRNFEDLWGMFGGLKTFAFESRPCRIGVCVNVDIGIRTSYPPLPKTKFSSHQPTWWSSMATTSLYIPPNPLISSPTFVGFFFQCSFFIIFLIVLLFWVHELITEYGFMDRWWLCSSSSTEQSTRALRSLIKFCFLQKIQICQ